MDNDTQVLLIILVISVGVLIYMQNCSCDESNNNFENETKENFFQEEQNESDAEVEFESDSESELDSVIDDNGSDNSTFPNPQNSNVNPSRNSHSGNSQELEKLIKEVNTGNNLIVDTPEADLYRKKAKSINAAKKYRNVSYKDSKYRTNFDGMPTNKKDQDELNKMYDNSLVFKNKEHSTNDNYTGVSEYNKNWGSADLKNFGTDKQETQQQKVQSLYNVNEYLPNKEYTSEKLEDGFQILDNPVAVSNPNLIPVLKSIPISTTSGSNKIGYRDLRALPPCPKTVVAPFLNSSVMPDIYATQRGCI
jgi:hypothetical protein